MSAGQAHYLDGLFGCTGRTAVVTGGGGTLGGAIGAAFARAGAGVALWGRRGVTLREKAKAIADACGDPNRVTFVEADLADESQVEVALRQTLTRVERIDILVNAAGGNRGASPLIETDADAYLEVLRLNLLAGCFLPTKRVARHWIESGVRGCVINLASMASFTPLGGVLAYSAAKAAVVSMTQAAARELAPHGIRVNAIAPGFFLAEQNRALLVDERTGEPTARGRAVLERTPFRRFGEPDELAAACLLLASEQGGGFITGATLPVDGGYLVDNI